jgi:predicted transposase YdaD
MVAELKLVQIAEEKGMEKGREEGRLAELVTLIQKKKLKEKTRGQIIDELELEEDEINILDNFGEYEYLIR